jgi:hypothetical protein
MASPEQQRAYIQEHVDTDLHFILEEAGVPLQQQYELTQSYKTVRVFSALADDRAGVRQCCKDELKLDPGSTPDHRLIVATIITAWETSKEFVSVDNKLKAEAKSLGVIKHLPNTERQAMRKSLEIAHGAFTERELPSNEYLSHKLEEIETHDMQAAPLDEVTSGEDTTTSGLQSTVDADGRIRVTRHKTKGVMPQTTEQLRLKHKIESNTWLMLAAKFKQKAWLRDLTPKTFLDFTEYILGPKVMSMLIPKQDGTDSMVELRPSWPIVLRYEHELRKAAFKAVREGRNTLHQALSEAVKDTELKELYFISPLALSKHQPAREQPPNTGKPWKYSRTNEKGGKSSSKGSKGGKGSKGKGGKASHTPDGRQICFKFNNSNCPGNCGRVHVCQVKGCYGSHSFKDHDREGKQKPSK